MTELLTLEQNLLQAQEKAELLFQAVEQNRVISAGRREKEVNELIYTLAYEMFGIKKYWHKRIVRAGKNTLLPYRENPPDLLISENDIVFLDFGPIFEQWEADFGRTYVIGNDPRKLKLRDDLKRAFIKGKEHFAGQPKITGAELYAYMLGLAREFDWQFGGPHAGHLIGEFPHEKIQGEEVVNYIHPQNNIVMRDPDKEGRVRHWILEVHFVDPKEQIGGFYEELLTI